MNTILIKDCYEYSCVYMIVTTKLTKDEINDIMLNVKVKNDDYNTEDLKEVIWLRDELAIIDDNFDECYF